ncbi:MAG: DUF6383 domain-containing protein [Paludibacter sp.]|nr:DUF6383 domain-containing protein [Paludibacter sp.]
MLTISLVGFGSGVYGQTSFLGVDGGFEGTATIDNSVEASAQLGKWTKSSASITLSDETSIVRTGAHSLNINNSATGGKRIWTPLITNPSTTSSITLQMWTLETDGSNTQSWLINIGNGTMTGEGSIYTSWLPTSAVNQWVLSTYTRSAWTFTDIAGIINSKKIGTGGNLYVDDVCMYNGDVDTTPPDAPTAAVVSNPTSHSLDISWTPPTTGVDGGGYLVVRDTIDPTTAPNPNGIYGVGNTISAGMTVVYQGVNPNFSDMTLTASRKYYYRIYTYDKAYNYSSAISVNGTTYDPSIALTDLTNPDLITEVGTPISQVINVSGVNLNTDLGLSITGNNADQFSLSQYSVSQFGGIVPNTLITITYNPTAVGTHVAILTSTSTGAMAVTRILNGTASKGVGAGIDLDKNMLKIYASNGTVILNADAGKSVEIFNVLGQELVQRVTIEGLNIIPVSATGVLLVKVDNQIVKVIL